MCESFKTVVLDSYESKAMVSDGCRSHSGYAEFNCCNHKCSPSSVHYCIRQTGFPVLFVCPPFVILCGRNGVDDAVPRVD